MSYLKEKKNFENLKIRTDIDPLNTWVISDTHFGHDNIVRFCHRPIDHDNIMIKEWNDIVSDDNDILHLGDLAFRNKEKFEIIASRLNGRRKMLVVGNHDNLRKEQYNSLGFEDIDPFVIKYKGYMVSFAHRERDPRQMNKRTVHVHGHIHNNGYSQNEMIPYLKQNICVSAEMIKYKPVNLASLLDAYLFGLR